MARILVRGPLPKYIEVPDAGGGVPFDDEDAIGVGVIGATILQNAGTLDEAVISPPLPNSNAYQSVRRYHITITVTNAGLCRIGIENVIGVPYSHTGSVEKSGVPSVAIPSHHTIGVFPDDGYEIHFTAEAGATYLIAGSFVTGPVPA